MDVKFILFSWIFYAINGLQCKIKTITIVELIREKMSSKFTFNNPRRAVVALQIRVYRACVGFTQVKYIGKNIIHV